MTPLLLACLALAIPPTILFATNLKAYRLLPQPQPAAQAVSVLIPARNEESSIGRAVESVLANVGCSFEVLVLDDRSEDATADVVRALERRDDRVRLIEGEGPPPGWCGKQRACWQLANEARNDLFLFLDADVRLAPDALARMVRFMTESGVDLASGIPRQETVGLMERLLIPLIHFVMLGFMPIASMRRTRLPSLSAGCGQLFIARREGYFQAGGHAAIRESLHDGIKLPRLFRAAGLRNDLFDATDAAECRMYRTAGEVWMGLSKNAGEALASPGLIVPMSIILLGGQVAPFALAAAAAGGWPRPWTAFEKVMVVAAVGVAWAPRLVSVGRFRQSLVGALLHPVGVSLLVAIQWYALVRKALGQPNRWKGRCYAASQSGSLAEPR
ncbi:glycosyltransferase family 2 protein [Planctomyces sp. SH-PL62]|uniref:glycosyltransferase family 2 protein n=1 Tax=Planctomyces sp. SH-PL62 TaxID=1636152 RepID=UPI00078ECB01|nr:glycosyltransferase family 2 protein [Planctomyces sp. SH-PL62]AMV39153.1 4,4'-diaponeurosporenoate glycosyltransferase [Planctomyces sp. SH-PL62]